MARMSNKRRLEWSFFLSSAANVNTLADGADIHGKVTLNACTVKEDGTIFPF